MRGRGWAGLAALVVLTPLTPPTHTPALAAGEQPSVTAANVTGLLERDGSATLQVDLDVDVPASRPALVTTLPTRVPVDGDPDHWQLLGWDSLTIDDVGSAVPFTTSRGDDALVVTAQPTRAGARYWTIRVVARQLADRHTALVELPRLAAPRTTVSLRGPAPLTTVACRRGTDACASVSNQSGLVAAVEVGPRAADTAVRLRTTWAGDAFAADSRQLVERLTWRTWWRRWWPSVAGGLAVAAVAAAAWRQRRK